MSFWNSKKIKKTRKIHRCEYCGAIVPIGSSCNNETGTYEGDFNNYYLCNRCVTFMDIYRDKSEMELGDFSDELMNTNLLDCPMCGSYNRREYDYKDNMQSISLECDNCDHKWEVDLSLEALEQIKLKDRVSS